MYGRWAAVFGAAWLGLDLLAAMLAPSGLDDPNFRSSVGAASTAQSISGLCFFIALVLVVIWGFRKVMDKNVNKTTNIVHGHQINASGFANVATDQAVIDQRKISGDSQISFLKSDENIKALDEIINFVSSSDLSDEKQKYASLLIESIQGETNKSEPDDEKIKNHIGSFVDIAKSLGPTANAVSAAIKLISKFV